MASLSIGSVDFGDLGTPLGSPVNRGRRKMVRLPGAYNLDGVLWDFGLAEGFFHVFQSQQNTGHLTVVQVSTLQAMFNNADTFSVQTDLLKGEGQVEAFTGTFDYESPPVYAPPTPDREFWTFILPLYLTPTGGP